MPITHAFNISLTENGTPVNSVVSSYSADGSTRREIVIAPAASNFSVVCAIKAASLKSIIMWADAAMTVLTKSAVPATVNTFNLVANKPLIWQQDMPTSNPITGDCVTLAVTSTPGGNLYIYFEEDA